MAVTPTPSSDLDSFLGEQPAAERVYDNVQASLPGVTVAPIKMALWNTIEEFALQSTMFRKTLDWTMGVNTQSIEFNPIDADTLTCMILEQTGLYRFRFDAPATLVDLDAPANIRAGKVVVATKPSSFAATMPADLFSSWFEAMLDGTLYRLYGQPAKPWTSTALAQFHGRRYRSAIGRGRALAQASHGPSATWHYPYFASGRRR